MKKFYIVLLCSLFAFGIHSSMGQVVNQNRRIEPSISSTGDTLFLDVLISQRPGGSVFVLGNADVVFTIRDLQAGLNLAGASIFERGQWSADATGLGDPAEYDSLRLTRIADTTFVLRTRKNRNAGTLSSRLAAFVNDPVNTFKRVAKIAIPIVDCSKNILITLHSNVQTQNPLGLRPRGATTYFDPALNLNFTEDVSLIAVALRNQVASPVLTCQNQGLGVRFSWNKPNNVTGYVLVVTRPTGGQDSIFITDTSVVDTFIARNPGQAATGVLLAVGKCFSDTASSATSTCSALPCPASSPANATVTPQTVCPGTTVNITIPEVSGFGAVGYSIDGGNTYTQFRNRTLFINGSSGIRDTTLQIRVRVNSDGCIVRTGTLTININNLNNTATALSITNKGDYAAPICGGNVTLNGAIVTTDGSPVVDNFPITWSTTGAGTFQPNNTAASVTYVPSPNDVGNVTFTLNDNRDCITLSDQVVVNYEFTPTVNWTLERNTLLSNSSDSILAELPSGFRILNRNLNANYTWNFGDGTTVTNADDVTTHTYTNDGEFTVVLRAVSPSGQCTAEVTRVVGVTRPQRISVPSAFSPVLSNDANSHVRVYGIGIDGSKFAFMIYSRWGEVVYETTNLGAAQNEGWNGKKNNSGSDLPVGTYTWVLKGSYQDGSPIEETGNVTLIK